jgi:hypothetical protein
LYIIATEWHGMDKMPKWRGHALDKCSPSRRLHLMLAGHKKRTKHRLYNPQLTAEISLGEVSGGWSLGLIGNASGKNSDNEVELDRRRFR